MNVEQESVFHKVVEGNNVFLTGSAGTGKSFTIGNIVGWAKTNNMHYGLTATTGIAAYSIRGQTIHSFLGIGMATKTAEHLANTTKQCKPYIYAKLRKLQLLVIDEISMLDADLFDKISQYLSILRNDSCPFGGVQVLLCGDFCQLPPVHGKYCFHSPVWKGMDLVSCKLNRCMRQEDITFVNMLEELRWGTCSPVTWESLSRLKSTQFLQGIEPTVLYSKNVDVDSINMKKHKERVQKGCENRTFATKYNKEACKSWADEKKIQESVELCISDQVMLTVNMTMDSRFYANGTRGVVAGFTTNSVLVQCKHGIVEVAMYSMQDDDEKPDCIVHFMPLRLAYAITIHKSQGMTLDAVVMDLGKSIFEVGQAYTALSRARNLESIQLLHLSKDAFQTHPDVVRFYKELL